MNNESNSIVIDAQIQPIDINDILCIKFKNFQINSVLNDLTVDECKSMVFLLMDYVTEDEFINVIKDEEVCIKQKLNKILRENNSILIELLGTLKMYKKLRTLGTCRHVYEKHQQYKFNNINGVWKMFYSLCEELTDIDLECLKQLFPDISKLIESAEEWFYWALQRKLISKTDFSYLEKLFHNYPQCLDIIKNFERPKSYDIRIPTANIDCGIAVILNYETFNDKFTKREGSDVDVKSLQDTWKLFGFKTEVHNNLTCDETLACLKHYAELDHSNYDAFVCCILSHGLTNSVISSDGEEMPIPVLIDAITNCRSLSLKPKLFFIQACQGTYIQQGIGEPVYPLKSPDMPERLTLDKPPITSDVLIAIASIDGYVSFRHTKTGSYFIQAFCEVMNHKGDKFSILDIMIEVNNNVRKKSVDLGPGKPRRAQQIANCCNTFEKILVLKKRTK